MQDVKIPYGELARVLRGIANDECNGKTFREITKVDDLISWLDLHDSASHVIVDVNDSDEAQDGPPYKATPPKQSVFIDDIIDKAVDQALHSVIEDLRDLYINYDVAISRLLAYTDDGTPSELHYRLAKEANEILDDQVSEITEIAKKGRIVTDKAARDTRKTAVAEILESTTTNAK